MLFKKLRGVRLVKVHSKCYAVSLNQNAADIFVHPNFFNFFNFFKCHEKSFSWRKVFSFAALFVIAMTIVVLSANFPARMALALYESSFARSAKDLLSVGLVFDFYQQLPFFFLVFALTWVTTRSRPITLGIFSTLVVVNMLAQVSATEFRIQRGVYPTPTDAGSGLTNTGFWSNSVHVIWNSRYLNFEISSIVVVALVSFFVWKKVRTAPNKQHETAAWLLGGAVSIVLAVVAFQVYLHSASIWSSITSRAEIDSPIDTFFLRSGIYRGNTIHSIRSEIVASGALPGNSNMGAALLGLPQQKTKIQSFPLAQKSFSTDSLGNGEMDRVSAKRKFCSQHPLRRSFSEITYHNPVLEPLAEFSKELFKNWKGPVHIWQVAAESFRGHEINGINPLAPKEIAPFVTAASTGTIAGVGRSIFFPLTFQAGRRTAQGVSAIVCGWGELDFAIAASRDLGLMPLRCLPDVLSDAGFVTRFPYGSLLDFEQRGAFFRYHGVTPVEESGLPKGLPQGAWGISDLAMIDQIGKLNDAKSDANNANAAGDGVSRYDFWLTLSNHGPNVKPDDFPVALDEKLKAVVARSNKTKIDRDDYTHLQTMAYTDFSLAQFVKKIEASNEGDRSIFIVSADHSTTDPLLFRPAKTQREDVLNSFVRVPFFIVLPES